MEINVGSWIWFCSMYYSPTLVVFTKIEAEGFFLFIFTDRFSSFEDLWSVLLKVLYLINKGGGLFVMNTFLYSSVSFAVCELSPYSSWPSAFVHYMERFIFIHSSLWAALTLKSEFISICCLFCMIDHQGLVVFFFFPVSVLKTTESF